MSIVRITCLHISTSEEYKNKDTVFFQMTEKDCIFYYLKISPVLVLLINIRIFCKNGRFFENYNTNHIDDKKLLC